MRLFPETKETVKWLYLAAFLLAGLGTALAQDAKSPAQNGPAATVQVNVKVVTMPVTVRDKHGAIVSTLTKDDFTLSEDGKPQTIKYFNHDTNLPLNLGLLVDTSMSQRNVLDDERTASLHFLDQMVTNAKDRAFVVQFDREVDLLEDLTSDKGKLRTAIDQLGAPQFQRTSSSDDNSGQGQGHHHYGGGTTLYDAIYLASNEVMKQQKGRKAIVVLTDGVDRGSKETLNSAIEAAQRADTVVYALYYKGEEGHSNGGGYPAGGRHGGWGYPGGGYPGGGGGYPGGRGGQRPQSQESHVDGKKILEQICGQTGGHMFEVTKKETADQAYTTIAEEMRSQYMLGYTPDKSSDAGYHKIVLTANKKDLIVQTREGYFAD
ncbi:MAG: VWA domain-containing protein [Silvibacterium sp.]|nr:VWA domain-containing protein [Silvibacterium sp.]